MKRDVSATIVRSREALVRRTMQDGKETMCPFNMLMESFASSQTPSAPS